MRKIILLFAITMLMMCGTACSDNDNLPDSQPQSSTEENGNLPDSQPQSSTEETAISTDSAPESQSDTANVEISDSLPQESTGEVTSPVETVLENQPDTETSSATSETEPEGFSIELDGYDCAVAYVGYTENADVNSVRKCVEESLVAEKYPFISDIADERVILAGGGEIYCIIPADTVGKITVNSLNYDENSAETIGDELYSGDNAPILLCCNVSDIMPNAAVSIANGENTAKFSPFISLRDGRLAIPDDLKILDFSEYEF